MHARKMPQQSADRWHLCNLSWLLGLVLFVPRLLGLVLFPFLNFLGKKWILVRTKVKGRDTRNTETDESRQKPTGEYSRTARCKFKSRTDVHPVRYGGLRMMTLHATNTNEQTKKVV